MMLFHFGFLAGDDLIHLWKSARVGQLVLGYLSKRGATIIKVE